MARRKSKGFESHVRLYAHEMQCSAWQTLDPDARSLLIEIRALYDGGENHIFLSVREAMRRLNIGQRRVQKAFESLLMRGWIREIEKGAFRGKRATVYALENEPLEDRDGAVAPKSYMRWQPEGDGKKKSVAKLTTVGSCPDYQQDIKPPLKRPKSSQTSYRKPDNSISTVADTATQLDYQGGAKLCSCGCKTVKATDKQNGLKLFYQKCPACGRCDSWSLNLGGEQFTGVEARHAFRDANMSENC